MAATGYSPIQLYYSTTASTAPTAGNLVSGELAINITDGKLYYKDNAGAVQLLSTSTTANGTANGVLYLNGSKVATSGSALTFDGTNLGLGVSSPSTSTGGILGFVVGGSNQAQIRLQSSNTGYTSNDGFLLSIDNNASSNAYVWNYENAAVIFGVNASEAMRLTSTGLGIGTSSPGAKLDVQPATYTFGTAQAEVIRIRGNASGGTTTSPTSAGALVWGNGTITQAVINSIIDNPSASSRSALAFSTNIAGTLTEAMRLDSSGNLGLGVTPSAWGGFGLKAFDVSTGASFYGSGGDAGMIANAYYDGSNWRYRATSPSIRYQQIIGTGEHAWFNAPSGTAGNAISFTQAMTLDASGRLLVGNTGNPDAAKLFVSGGVISHEGSAFNVRPGSGVNYEFVNRVGAGYDFYVNNATNLAARIDSSGNLLVGTTSGYSNQQGFYFGAGAVSYTSIGHTTAAVSGDLYARFVYNGTGIGSITQNGTTAVAYNTSSDYRLKDNQQPLTGSGAFIDALQPKTWNWKADGSRGVGFIAHEVQEVSPGSVVGEKDGEQMQAMEYGSAEFIANIVAELQSLRARVAQLESN